MSLPAEHPDGGPPAAPSYPRGSDRRRAATSVWAAFRPGGRREENRRIEDRDAPYYVDRFDNRYLLWILLLLTFTIADGVFTLLLLDGPFEEANPAMALLLHHGATWFVLGKYVLTAWGLPVLLVFKNHAVFHPKVRVGMLIPIFVGMYLVLLVYQMSLLEIAGERMPGRNAMPASQTAVASNGEGPERAPRGLLETSKGDR